MPWLLWSLPLSELDVYDKENDSQHETDTAHSDVGDAKEVILASQERRRGEYHTFAASKAVHGIVVLHLQLVCALRVKK